MAPSFAFSDRESIFFNSHNVSKPESSSVLTAVCPFRWGGLVGGCLAPSLRVGSLWAMGPRLSSQQSRVGGTSASMPGAQETPLPGLPLAFMLMAVTATPAHH